MSLPKKFRRAPARAATKSAPGGGVPAPGGMVHPGYGGQGGGRLRWLLPGTQFDYEAAAGDLWRNSAVAACLRVIADNFPEPRLEAVVDRPDGTAEVLADQGLPGLVDRPNDYYDGDTLWEATSLSLECDGNAYWFKVRSPAFKVVELWYVPHFMLEPLWPSDGSRFISAYLYTVNGRRYVIDRDDVVHFRQGIDPRNERLGLSRVKQACREVASDNGAATWTAALVKNAGVPAVVIVPLEDGASFAEGEPEAIKQDWREYHSGDGVGTPLVTSSVKVQKLGFSPKEMALGDLPDRFEDRICGLTGVPAMLAGLTAGASHKTYANYPEARKSYYEDKQIPAQKRVAKQLTQQLYEADFAGPAGAYLRWNYRDILCLRENLNDTAERVGRLYQVYQVIKRKHALDALDYPSGPEDDVYFADAAPKALPAPAPPKALPAPEGAADAGPDEDEDDEAVKDAWRRLEVLGGDCATKTLGDKPPGDVPDAHEDNSFGLPDGRPLRRALKRVFAQQAAAVLGTIPEVGAPLPATFPTLADYDDPMASAMTPLISAYWDWGGRTTRERLGLDPDSWRVIDPNLHRAIADSTLKFCAKTNATTGLRLDAALDELRAQFQAGLAERGETVRQLRDRVLSIFKGLKDEHAEMIARTEASRAVHAASLMSAGQSGVVSGKRWLASANSCDACREMERATKADPAPLGDAFARDPKADPAYATTAAPPLHPHCRCTIVYDLTPEYRSVVDGEGGTAPESVEPLNPRGPWVRRKADP